MYTTLIINICCWIVVHSYAVYTYISVFLLCYDCYYYCVAAWLSGISEVTLCWAQLVPEWVTVCGQVNHLSLQPATQVNSLLPSAEQKMSIGQSAVTLCG